MRHLYPICLNLEGKNCLVIGGGLVSERKVSTLLEYGAQVAVVSPEVTGAIREWGQQGLVQISLRTFQEGDLEGVFLAFIATNDSQLNGRVATSCIQKGILMNVADDPLRCDFFVPATLRRDALSLSISTEGKSPAFARRLRKELETMITPAYGEFVELLGRIRDELQIQESDIGRRKQILEKLVYSDILDLMQAGEQERVKEIVRQCMSF